MPAEHSVRLSQEFLKVALIVAAGVGCAPVALRASQLLEHSLLGELRTVVARALSGLEMFSEADADFSRTVAGEPPITPKNGTPMAQVRRTLAARHPPAPPSIAFYSPNLALLSAVQIQR